MASFERGDNEGPQRVQEPRGRSGGAAQSGALQLKVAASQRGDYDAQAQALAPVQRRGGPAGADGVHAAAAHGISGGGGAMPHGDTIQQAFGSYDLSNVHAHTDSAAAEGSAAMGAEAYATGDHVAFGGAPDLHTAAHEAAHVIQQRGGVSLSGGVGQAGDAYEQHADKVADAVVAGQSAEPLLAGMAGGGGSVQQKAVQRVETTPVDASHVRGSADAQVNLTGQSMAAAYADNPDFEQDATNFEAMLGAAAMTRASAIATGLASKALGYLKQKVRSTVEGVSRQKEKLDELLTACGSAQTHIAGAVGLDPRTIEFIASAVRDRAAVVAEAEAAGKAIVDHQTPPNVREQMTFLYNAGTKIIARDLLTDGAAAVSARLGATAEEKAKLEAKVAEITQLAAERARDAQPGTEEANPMPVSGDVSWGVPNRPASNGDGAGGAMGTQGTITTDSGALASSSGAGNHRAVLGQGQARVNRTAVNDALTPSRLEGADARSPEAVRKRQATDSQQTKSTRTPNDLRRGTGTTGRENAHMGISPDDVLTWAEGDKSWFINEADTWVQAIRALGLPLAAGPSGTTTAIMNTNELIAGTTAENARLCAIGYLLPIHAHTLVEVMTAASAFGASFTAGRQMYTNIAPFTPRQLRSLGRLNPQAATDPEGRTTLFPHESNPPPPAVTPTTGGATGGPPTQGGGPPTTGT
jgi:hypothetical protein